MCDQCVTQMCKYYRDPNWWRIPTYLYIYIFSETFTIPLTQISD